MAVRSITEAEKFNSKCVLKYSVYNCITMSSLEDVLSKYRVGQKNVYTL